MAGFSMEFSQNQQLSQQMTLSPQMLQSLNFLMMNNQDLTTCIYEEVQKNPALEIVKDAQCEIFEARPREKKKNIEETSPQKTSPSDAATNFQQFLENQADKHQGIQENLWEQFKLTTADATKLAVAEKFISTLDESGFSQVAPISLLDEKDRETTGLLKQVVTTIQNLEPVGCGTSGPQESLYVQALSRCKEFDGEEKTPPLQKDAQEIVLFLVAGNLCLLEKLRIPVIVKKLQELQATSPVNQEPPLATRNWTYSPQFHQLPKKITDAAVESAINFIKSLDPLPARQFSSVQGSYIYPEITVEQYQDDGHTGLKVILNHRYLPDIILSPIYSQLNQNKKALSKDEGKFINATVKSAQDFLDSLNFRKYTLEKAALALVEFQRDFFLLGPRALRPLTMKDMADKIQVHETTVSRLVNEKYLRCEWGVFKLKYFFSRQVESTQSDQSKESVKFLLKEILEKQAQRGKPLSDQKLADMLGEHGIKIARRTVAKYRQELNIDSSFDRK
jgi:RNA polymerase sigma-54 factor